MKCENCGKEYELYNSDDNTELVINRKLSPETEFILKHFGK